jgi:hypothetical protein
MKEQCMKKKLPQTANSELPESCNTPQTLAHHMFAGSGQCLLILGVEGIVFG